MTQPLKSYKITEIQIRQEYVDTTTNERSLPYFETFEPASPEATRHRKVQGIPDYWLFLYFIDQKSSELS
jgi:hypothetical protein